MAPKANNKNKVKNKKSKSKSPLLCISLNPFSKRSSSPTKSTPSPRSSISPTRSSSVGSSSPLRSASVSSSSSPIRSSPISSSSSPLRYSPSPTRSSPSPTRYFPSSRQLFSSLLKPSPSLPRLTPTSTKTSVSGSLKIYENEYPLPSNSKALPSILNNENDISQKKNLKRLLPTKLENIEKKRCHFLLNHLSPARTPPDELHILHDETTTSSSNQVNIPIQKTIRRSKVQIELQYKSHESPPPFNQLNTPIQNIDLLHEVGIELQQKSHESPLVCSRPKKKGVVGTLVEVVINHFKCTKIPNKNIVTYTIEFQPPIKSKESRWALKRDWESKYHDTHLGGKYLIYDGLHTLFVYQSLNFTRKFFSFQHYDQNEEFKTYQINITLCGSNENEAHTSMRTLEPSALTEYLKKATNEYPNQNIQAMNWALKQDICVGDIERGRVLYPLPKKPTQKRLLGMLKTRIMQGYIRSFKLTQQGLALNVDTFEKIFHERSKVLDFLKILLEYKEDVQHMAKNLEMNRFKVLKALKGLVVETNHYSDKISRTHKITGLTEESARMLTIQTNDGINRNDHAKSFNLEFEVKPARAIARILPAPLLNKDFCPSDHLIHWGILNLSQHINSNEVGKFIGELTNALIQLGFKVSNFQYTNGSLLKSWPLEYMEVIHKKIWDAIPKKDEGACINLIVVILDGKKNYHYNEIKYWGDCIKGVPTQIIASDVIARPNCWQKYFQNVGMKINCRLGGTNVQFKSWNEIQRTQRAVKDLKYGRFIAFGADVTHPDAGSNNPSLASVVASLDFGCSYFGVKLFQQGPGQEIMTTKLESVVRDLLLDFKAYNHQRSLPENIIYYRDGVGDTQFESVMTVELPQIQRGASAAEPGYTPKISLVIVQKRHRTRMFPPEALKWDDKYVATRPNRLCTVQPGTVVDSVVCDPHKFDFYLCSHQVPVGTPRPPHYNLIYDDANLSVDDLQNLTHYLCHTFQRCTCTISMPAPAYYAHLSAFRARQVYYGAKEVQRRKNPPPLSMPTETSGPQDRRQNSASPPRDTRRNSMSPPREDIMDFPPIHENHRFRMFYI